MLGALRIALVPILLWQGRQVRRNILRMPEPDGPRTGDTGQGAPLRLLILGDSSAAGVGCKTQNDALSGHLARRLSQRFALTWRLHAKTGWTTGEAEQELPALGGEPFDLAVISLGVNDVTCETGIETWLATYERLLTHLRRTNGVQQFVLSGLPPMGRFPALPQPLRWYMGLQRDGHDKALASWAARQPDVSIVAIDFDAETSEMAPDGFHPGPAIYARWAERITEMLLAKDNQADRSESALPA